MIELKIKFNSRPYLNVLIYPNRHQHVTQVLVVKPKEWSFEYPALGLVKKHKPCFTGTGKGFGWNYQEATSIARHASDPSIPFSQQRKKCAVSRGSARVWQALPRAVYARRIKEQILVSVMQTSHAPLFYKLN